MPYWNGGAIAAVVVLSTFGFFSLLALLAFFVIKAIIQRSFLGKPWPATKEEERMRDYYGWMYAPSYTTLFFVMFTVLFGLCAYIAYEAVQVQHTYDEPDWVIGLENHESLALPLVELTCNEQFADPSNFTFYFSLSNSDESFPSLSITATTNSITNLASIPTKPVIARTGGINWYNIQMEGNLSPGFSCQIYFYPWNASSTVDYQLKYNPAYYEVDAGYKTKFIVSMKKISNPSTEFFFDASQVRSLSWKGDYSGLDTNTLDIWISYTTFQVPHYYTKPRQTWSAFVLSLLGLLGTFISVTMLASRKLAQFIPHFRINPQGGLISKLITKITGEGRKDTADDL